MDAALRQRLEKIFPKEFLATMVFDYRELPWASQIAIDEDDVENVIFNLDEETLQALEEYHRLLITLSPQATAVREALTDVVNEPILSMIEEHAIKHLPLLLRTIQ